MITYITYQCSVCRRTKDIERDDTRALPTQCIITKGCTGSLYKIGETLVKNNTPSVPGLTDWYARGKKFLPASTPESRQFIALSCSETGALSIALRVSGAFVAQHPKISVVLRQRLTADIPYTEFSFNLRTETAVVSGKDSTGKNMRFDQAAIDAGRVQVLVNGVLRDMGSGESEYVAAPNIITFNTPLPAGTVVAVSVFNEAPTTLVNLEFIRNDYIYGTANLGAWGNIRWFDQYVEDPSNPGIAKLGGDIDGKRWWIYTAMTVSPLAQEAQYQFENVIDTLSNETVVPSVDTEFSDVRFVLSKSPHGYTDRYLNVYVGADELTDGFYMRSSNATITELYAISSVFKDVNPPFQLIGDGLASTMWSYISSDTYPAVDTVSADTPEYKITTPKTIGPV